MKKLMMTLVTLFSMVTLTVAQQPSDSVTLTKDGYAIAKIKTSAVCDMCKETLEKAMAYEKGVKDSKLDVETKVLTVKYDPKKTDLAKIRTAVANSGYDADAVPANPKAYDKLNACCKKDAVH